MREWPVHDKILPFVCENASCAKEFDQFEFTTAINTGYVRLTNGEFTFLGMVCPKCHYLTIRKYPQKAIKSFSFPDFGQPRYVPFPIDPSIKLTDENQEPVFSVPSHIPILNLSPTHIPSLEGDIEYPKWFLELCRCDFTDSDIKKLVAYENEHQIKVFPRIVAPGSVYGKTDIFLPSIITDSFPEKSGATLDFNPDRVWCQVAEIAKDHYLSGAETTFSEAEYKDLAIEFIVEPGWEKDHLILLQNLLQEYLQKRSDYNFYRTWKTDFFDKYIKQLLYRKGYFESPQYYQDKWYYEDLFGKVFKGRYKKIDRSQLKERLTCKKAAEMLGMEPTLLANFITEGDLPAYYPDGSYYDPRSQSVQNVQINPDNFVFLRSEVEELLLIHPWIIKEDSKSADDSPASPEDFRKNEYARFLFEEDQWDASIKAAVEIGLESAKNNTKFSCEKLIDFIDNVSPASPVSSIELIWESLPDGYKKADQQLETPIFNNRKNSEYRSYLSLVNEVGIARNLAQKRRIAEKRNISIKAALYLSMAVQQAGGKFKNPSLETVLYSFDKNITAKLARRIFQNIPPEFRFSSGNPGKNQRDEVAVLSEILSKIF